MKAAVCGGDFSMRLIERSISHKLKRGMSNVTPGMKIQHSKQTSLGFYVETHNEKNHGEERRNSLFFMC